MNDRGEAEQRAPPPLGAGAAFLADLPVDQALPPRDAPGCC